MGVTTIKETIAINVTVQAEVGDFTPLNPTEAKDREDDVVHDGGFGGGGEAEAVEEAVVLVLEGEEVVGLTTWVGREGEGAAGGSGTNTIIGADFNSADRPRVLGSQVIKTNRT